MEKENQIIKETKPLQNSKIVENSENAPKKLVEENEIKSETKPYKNNFNKSFSKSRRKSFSRKPIKTDFETAIVKIKKVTKVVKGGRRFRFSILVLHGNKKGKIGFGLSKAYEVPDALKKAQKQASKSLITIPLIGKAKTIPHVIIGKHESSSVFMKPAKEGTGIIAGGAVRTFLELAGIKNVYTKAIGSREEVNVILAIINAFENTKTIEEVASLRDKDIKDII